MNFRLIVSGYRFGCFDDCVQLISYSAGQSDYIVSIKGFKRLSPFSPYLNEINLTGSAKKYYKEIILDMDGVITNAPKHKNIFLTPDMLELSPYPDCVHYWGMLGALFKIVGDISPAYVTGFLLEKNMKKELETFTSLSSYLPAALQAAIAGFIQEA